MKRIIPILLAVLVMVGAAATYAWEVFVIKTPWNTHLLHVIAIETSMLAFLLRGCRRKEGGLNAYRKAYAEYLGRAFFDHRQAERKLLFAVRHYHEGRFKAAIRILEKLRPACQHKEDTEAVLLMLALSDEAARQPEQAIAVYRELLNTSPHHTTAMRNLGLLLVNHGSFDEAEAIYRRAIELEPREALGYHNLASLYYRKGDFAAAKPMAEEALARKGNLHQAASLLAIIAALEGDDEAQQKYSQIAVANGENAIGLKLTIDRQLVLAQKQNSDT